jgi:hypothetical protein
MMMRGLGDCDPSAMPGDASYCGGSVYGVDSAGNTIVQPGPTGILTPGVPAPSPTPTPVSTATFAQSFFSQTGIQFQSAALFVAGLLLLMTLGGKKR